MDQLLYNIARLLVKLLQALPLRGAARLGRAGGAVAYVIDLRHRRIALANLTLCFGIEMSRAQIRAIARENFRRIGENYACAIKTASMGWEQLRPHVEFVAAPEFLASAGADGAGRRVVAIGHFGNFELYARFGDLAPQFQCATTYRGLRQDSLNRLMQSLRERSGCLYFERRFDGPALKTFMHREGIILGLLTDQHAGNSGLRLPFLGHDCSTTASPAVFALRYNCALHTGICYRVGLARWRIEAGGQIPTHHDGKPRASNEIMADVNRALEAAVRRDPANWFWVHKRWKPAPAVPRPVQRGPAPSAPSLSGAPTAESN